MGKMYDNICSWGNLLLAYGNAARGKRGRYAAAAFEYNLADRLLELGEALTNKTYRPGAYSSFTIHAPKRRLISAAPFRDHALCNAIEPVFERSFVYDSYANRIGKGTHRALDRARVYARRHRYVLQCDVRQFFPSIDHAILARKVDDPDVLWLVDRILWPNLPESRHDPWLTTRDENGTPGAVIAPLRLFSEQLAVCRRTSVAAACKSCFDLLRCETQVRSYKPRLQSVTPTDCQDASGSQAD